MEGRDKKAKKSKKQGTSADKGERNNREKAQPTKSSTTGIKDSGTDTLQSHAKSRETGNPINSVNQATKSRKRNLDALTGGKADSNDVAGTQSSPWEVVTAVFRVSLPPSYIGDIQAGVNAVLNSYVMKYRDDVDGVIMAYSKVDLCTDHANILNENPYILFSVKARALIFRPQKGMVLRGKVNKVGSNHIGMLVNGIFNASIPGNEVSDGYVFNPHKDAWTNEADNTIKVDDEVEFRVANLFESSGLIAISGSLKPDAEDHSEDHTSNASAKKKRRKGDKSKH